VVTRVCVSVRGRMPTLYCTVPDVTLGNGMGKAMPPSCALLRGFAIGAPVALRCSSEYYMFELTVCLFDIVFVLY